MRKVISLFVNKKGTAAIEAAILLPAIFMLMMGIISFGKYYWIKTSMQNSVMAGGRYAMLHTNASDSEIISIAAGNIPGIDPNTINYQISTSSLGGINYKSVMASHNYSTVGGILGNSGKFTIQRRITVPIVR